MYGRSVDKSVIRSTWVDFFFNIKGLFIYFKDNPCLVLVYLFLNNAILLMSHVPNYIHGLTQWPQSYTVAFNTVLFLEFFTTHITWYTV